MSPALVPHVSSPSIASAGVPALPVFKPWHNPLPANFKEIDGRRHYLQTKGHRFLEMHPNGTRGVGNRTDYCILTILVYTITQELMARGGPGGPGGQLNSAGNPESYHIIRGNKTGHFLCMDDNSVIFQSREFNQTYCTFRNEAQDDHREVYYRQNGTEKWYIGLNKDGTVRCGNTTKRSQSGVRFLRISAGQVGEHTTSPPFVEHKKECCKSNRCKRKGGKKNGRRRRRCYKNWCKKHRRRFFKLKLKDLKRYYNRCIKKESKCHKKNGR